MRRHAVILLPLALVLACETADDTAPATAEATRPETATDTIMLEGMPEAVQLRLFAPDGFEPAFSTYVPERLVAETADGGESVRFRANFGHALDEEAFMLVHFYPPGTPEAEVRSLARGYVTAQGMIVGRGIEEYDVDYPKRFDWSLVEFDFYSDELDYRRVGTMAVGEHEGSYFHVLINYPEALAEGFVPRARMVLDRWRWADTGGGLTREQEVPDVVEPDPDAGEGVDPVAEPVG